MSKNLKVICVDTCGEICVTKGKVYERIDGFLYNDFGIGWRCPHVESDNPSEWKTKPRFELNESEEKPQPKYKTGDRVVIRKDLKEGFDFSHYVNPKMEAFKGRSVEICGIYNDENFRIKGDDDCYVWGFDMIEGLAPKYYTGKIVCVKASVHSNFIKGRIYQVKNGRFDSILSGHAFVLYDVKSVQDINKRLDTETFIELIED